MPIGIGLAMLISGIVSALGGLASSGLNAASQKGAQDFNAEEAEKSRQFSAEEAEKNRDFEAAQSELTRQWQTDMSNTAYQRSMVDMEKAGINPNLLSSGAMGAATGNASTPQGSQAQTSAASIGATRYDNMFSGVANALNAYASVKNSELIAQMYNDTSKFNNSVTNNTRRYATDVTSANFQQSVWKYRKKAESSGFGDSWTDSYGHTHKIEHL